MFLHSRFPRSRMSALSRSRGGLRTVCATVIILFAIGCVDDPTEPDISQATATDVGLALPPPLIQQQRPHEVLPRQLSEQIPEFAGFFMEDGRVRVLVTDVGVGAAVKAEVQERLSMRRPENAEAVRPEMESDALLADYSFLDLAGWRDRITEGPWMRREAGIVSVDLHEQSNRVVVGVLPEADLESAEEVVSSLGIPSGAVVLKRDTYATVDVGRQLPRAVPVAAVTKTVPATADHLNRRWDTVMAGVQYIYEFHDGSAILCTMGPLFSGGFLTNAHCTNQEFEFDGLVGWQGNNLTDPMNPSDEYGIEVTDPKHFCGTNCRWSDAASHSWNGMRVHGKGLIAKPENMQGSLWRDMTVLGIEVWGKLQAPLEGETVHKIGRAGGWSAGTVIRVCEDRQQETPSGRIVNLKCQDIATYSRTGGDSGAPVFKMDGEVAYILGMHSASTLEGDAVFSAVGNMELDLGITLDLGPWPWQQ